MQYLSKTPGIGGRLKSSPEDFLVEEISDDGTVLELDKQISKQDEEGDFTHFVLQKRDWSTSSAIYEIANRLNTGQKRFNFAGTKDKAAITTQLVSGYQIPKEKLLSLKIKDISINGAWTAKDKVRLGQLLGNRFTIRVEGATNTEMVEAIHNELNNAFLNYFGEQRFGSTRRNTHIVGQKLLQGRLQDAVNIFLCDSEGEENEKAKQARKDLAESGNYAQALKDYPKYLRLERKVIAYLDQYPGNYANAMRRLPRSTLLLFVHALQSHIFNKCLEQRIPNIELEEGEYYCGESNGFPDISKQEAEGWVVGKLVGYNSPINEREKAIMEELNVSKEDFKMKWMPELGSKGTYRPLLAPYKNFSYDDVFRFELAAGCYATVLMREFLDEKT
jgi:tRNA pseudouridine13 synthase